MSDFASTGRDTADKTAVVGRRVVALIIDGLIGWALCAAVFFAIADKVPDPSPAASAADLSVPVGDYVGDSSYVLQSASDAAPLYFAAGAYILFLVVLTGFAGVTVGKAITGVRVVDDQGEAPGIVRALGRTIAWVVDAMPYIIPGLLGFILAAESENHRRVGDRLGGTYVVGKDRVAELFDTSDNVDVAAQLSGTEPPSGPATAAMGTAAWPSATGPDEGLAAPAEPLGQLDPLAAQADPMAAQPDPMAAQPDPLAAQPEPQQQQPAAAVGEPQWDPARRAYIHWDPHHQRWLQYDDVAGQWGPIS